MSDQIIIAAIDASPMNRGLSGSDWLSTPGNIPIVIGDNVALFDAKGDGTFEVHVLFVSKGRNAILAMREAFRRMFVDHGALNLYGMAPSFRREVILFARWMGMKHVGKRYTPFGFCNLHVLSREMWELQK